MSNLKSYLRTVALTTQLPCNPSWYNEVIDYGLNNEVEVYPMTHKDEILIHNPDALFSGNSVSQILTSCIPAIKKVDNVYMPDVEAMLLAIKIASVGDDLETYNICPECFEKYKKLPEEERNKLVEEKKLSVEPQTFIFAAKNALDSMEKLPNKFIVDINDAIKVYIKPLTLKENTTYELNNFIVQNKIQEFIRNSKDVEANTNMLTDFEKWNENRLKSEEFNNLLTELDKVAAEMLRVSIKYITLNGEILTNEEDINELLDNISKDKFDLIKQTATEANRSRINKTYACECKYCGHKWSNDNLNFNFANFFGKGS